MSDAIVDSFVDEFRKIAEVPMSPQYDRKELLKQVAMNVGQGAVGYGLGYGAGHIFDKVILPRIGGASMSPTRRAMLANAMGALSGIGSIALKRALGEAQRKVEYVKSGGHSTGV